MSDAPILSYMDVDLSTDIGCISDLIAPLRTQACEISVGSRLLPESETERSWHRELISRGYAALVRETIGLQLSDYQCGFKAITRTAARDILPKVEDNGWFFDTELLAVGHHLGFRIHEVPVCWREDRNSKVRILSTAWENIKGLRRVSRKPMRGAESN